MIQTLINMRMMLFDVHFHSRYGIRFLTNNSCSNKTTYIVIHGRKPGVYLDWAECLLQVHKHPSAEFKKFEKLADAQVYLKKSIAYLNNEKKNSKILDTQKILTSMLKYCQTDVCESRYFSVPGEGLPFHAVEEYQQQKEERRDLLEEQQYNYLSSQTEIALARENDEKEFFYALHSYSEPSETDHSLSMIESIKDSVKSNPELHGKDSNNKFDHDEDGRVNVYTDGSCKNNGQENAAAGIGVYFGDDNTYNLSIPLVGKPRNNNAEIHAAIRGIENAVAAGFSKVRVITDSKYVIMGATVWSKNWVQNGFRGSKGKIVNEEAWKKLLSVCSYVDVQWAHVKGHDVSNGNLIADKLAKGGAEQGLI